MNAIFKKYIPKLRIIVFSGLALAWIIVCVLLIMRNDDLKVGNFIGFFGVEILICFFGFIPSLYNFKAYLQIDDNKINGRFGFFGRLDCDISQVDFVISGFNTITILLKNKKRYTVSGVENAYDIMKFIRRKMPFEPQNVTKELVNKANKRQNDQKRNIILVYFFIGLMFALLFITMALTGARDLPEFNNLDFVIFSIMCAFEAVVIVLMFYFALKSGKGNIYLAKQFYELRRSVIENAPLFGGHVQKIMTDDECFARVTVVGCSDDSSVYYMIQRLNENYELNVAYKSEIFENQEALSEELSTLWDITEKFK